MDQQSSSASNPRRTIKQCPDTASDGNLIIDDCYSSLPKIRAKKVKVVRAADEPVDIDCTWDNCGINFHDFYNFTYHVEEHASEAETMGDMYACCFGSCEYATNEHAAFSRHLAFHTYHERLKNIGENVVKRQKLPACRSMDHLVVGEIKIHECKWNRCNSVFDSMNEFLYHMKKHTDLKPKVCTKGTYHKCEWFGCNLKFTALIKLTDHVRSHTSEKVAACPSCGNLFASKPKFSDHRKRQMPSELHGFQCSECSKLFPTERLLREHMRSHINHYKCSLCDMTCSRPSTLALHVRYRHMSERPFKCSFCEFAAVTKGNLECHLITHCAESIYACEYCDFRCRSLPGLDLHVAKQHIPENLTKYRCHCCQNGFLAGSILTKHLIKVHGYNWPSGHSRFKYKQDADGFFRLQTMRYESVETVQEDIGEKPIVDSNYDVDITADASGKLPSFVISLKEKQEAEHTMGREVLIDINDLDEKGNIIKHETLISQEIIKRGRNSTSL